MRIAIHQPNYLPWLGYFAKMAACDRFIYLDDAEYSKNSFINRNSVKSKDGALLLTVPVRYKGHSNESIMQIQIADHTVLNRHWKSLTMCYSRAPHWSTIAPILEPIFTQRFDLLIELNIALLNTISKFLDIRTETIRSSTLAVDSHSSERLAQLAHKLGASSYISGAGARTYNDPAVFESYGITLKYLAFEEVARPQLWGDFLPRLSVIDALFNLGYDCRRLIAQD